MEAAGVGEDGFVPAAERMQTAEPGDALGAGAQHEVIGVAEHDLGAGGVDIAHLHRLHARLCADGHEGWRLDRAVGRGEPAASRRTVGGQKLKTHRARSRREASP